MDNMDTMEVEDEHGTPGADYYAMSTGVEELPTKGSILSEIKTLEDRLKEIEQHLTQYVSGMDSSTTVLKHSDHEILEQFHRVGNDIAEKWSPVEISLKLESSLNSLSTLQSKILTEELFVWKREQQLSKNGFGFTKSLENIQKLLSQLIDIHNNIYNQIQQLGKIYQIQQFKECSTTLLHSLLNAAFIVEHQPPQLIKVNTKFPNPVTLRLLLGSKLHIINQPNIKASIISEAQAKVLNTSSGKQETSGVIANGTAKINLANLTAEFNNLKLKGIERKIKKGVQQVKVQIKQGSTPVSTETVTDEKFCLHFQTEIRLHSLDYKVSTISLPVVVITHGVQESQGWATITWDNGFSNPYRFPFEVPPAVSWNILSETLHQKFQSVTGKGLEPREISVLKSKFFHEELINLEGTVSFLRFCKKPMASSSATFSFWDWYWNSLKLIEKYGRQSWENGMIYGFIGRTEAETVLQSSPPGTFLIRFSDTVVGGISICYVASNGEVFSLLPFTSKNFAFRSLGDTIWDLENLHTLFPNIPKHIAFPRTTEQLHSPISIGSPSSGNTAQSTSSSMNYEPSQYIVSYPKITIPVQFT